MYKNFDDFHPQNSNRPKHVAIIPDGGRRWARKHNISYYEAYKVSCQRLYDICIHLYEYGVDIVSVYFSSSQNFRRTPSEIESFCKAYLDFFNEGAYKLTKEFKVNIKVVGRREGIPEYLVSVIDVLESLNRCDNDKILYICMNYNPHDELLAAFDAAKESNDLYINYLAVKEPVNIMIRTGGAQVISNFLMMQMGFARLFFYDKLFNDLEIRDVTNVISNYVGYELKYGN